MGASSSSKLIVDGRRRRLRLPDKLTVSLSQNRTWHTCLRRTH